MLTLTTLTIVVNSDFGYSKIACNPPKSASAARVRSIPVPNNANHPNLPIRRFALSGELTALSLRQILSSTYNQVPKLQDLVQTLFAIREG